MFFLRNGPIMKSLAINLQKIIIFFGDVGARNISGSLKHSIFYFFSNYKPLNSKPTFKSLKFYPQYCGNHENTVSVMRFETKKSLNQIKHFESKMLTVVYVGEIRSTHSLKKNEKEATGGKEEGGCLLTTGSKRAGGEILATRRKQVGEGGVSEAGDARWRPGDPAAI